MKVRIRFSKSGALVYIGHLDVMRYFQKLFRRAQIPVAYSEGFSPHQILSFTPPLPLGMESTGEYADVELTETISTKKAMDALRAESVPEIGIMSFKELPEDCQNAMASVTAARYSIALGNNNTVSDIKDRIASFLRNEKILIIRKTKKNEKTVNIRPLVYELEFDTDNLIINMLISSGSIDNIKPGHVLEGLGITEDQGYDTECITVERIDQYTTVNGSFVSLDDLGCDIL